MIDCSVAAGTVTAAKPWIPPLAAMTLPLPCATPVAIPVLATVTIPIALDDQLTADVQSVVEPSEELQTAANC